MYTLACALALAQASARARGPVVEWHGERRRPGRTGLWARGLLPIPAPVLRAPLIPGLFLRVFSSESFRPVRLVWASRRPAGPPGADAGTCARRARAHTHAHSYLRRSLAEENDEGAEGGGHRGGGAGRAGALERVFGVRRADPGNGVEGSRVVHPHSPFYSGACVRARARACVRMCVTVCVRARVTHTHASARSHCSSGAPAAALTGVTERVAAALRLGSGVCCRARKPAPAGILNITGRLRREISLHAKHANSRAQVSVRLPFSYVGGKRNGFRRRF